MVADVTLGILLHLALGLALAGLIWGCGLGLASAFRTEIVLAYPLGLLAALVAATLVLYNGWLGILALVGLGCAAALAVRRRPSLRREIPVRVPRALVWSSPAAFGLAVALGTYYHGPGRTYDSWAGGDIAFYAARISVVRHSFFPFDDLALAGHRSTYAESGPSVLGAVASHIPGFDPFLFTAATLPLLAMLSVTVGFALLERPEREPGWTEPLVVSALSVSMVAYGSWLVESSPVALSAPLAFPMYALYRHRRPLGALVAATALLAVLCLSLKVVVLVPLGVLSGTALLRDHRGVLKRTRAVLSVLTALAVAVVLAVLIRPASSVGGPIHLRVSTWDTIRALSDVRRDEYRPSGVALSLFGAILLIGVLVLARRYAVAGALGVSVALQQVVNGVNFYAAIGVAIFAVAIDIWARPGMRRHAVPLVGAALLLCASSVARDLAPPRTADIFVLLIGGTVASALAASVRSTSLYACAWGAIGVGLLFGLAGRGILALVAPFAVVALLYVVRSAGAGMRLLAGVGFAAVAVALAGATAVAAHRDNLRLRARPSVAGLRGPVTSEDWDVWRYVRRHVPSGALIFTSLTGTAIDESHGWNYYAMSGGRQLYIAGWINGDFRDREQARAARLRANAEVLSGNVRPCVAPAARSFPAYYAVLERSQRPPPHARLVHANPSLAVYRLRDCST